ncbi:MAG: hypothetical protein BGO21_22125 [Dyadobacter sp. 50-39]|jgi:hypothetical protein|nr:MAG: hypothetical protein BGO21_22125 [Dyadobacter sp. 50-39]
MFAINRGLLLYIIFIIGTFIYSEPVSRMRKINFSMALRWLIFLPFILGICVAFGAFQGVVSSVKRMCWIMLEDMEIE